MRAIWSALCTHALLPLMLSAQTGSRPSLVSPIVVYYPQELRAITGRVVLRFVVSTDGRVDTTSIAVAASTDARLDESARFTATRLHFTPGYSQGGPVKVLVLQAITFTSHSTACAAVLTPLLTPQCADSLPQVGS